MIGEYFGAFTQATLRHIITASLFVAIALLLNKFGKVYWMRDAKWLALSAITSAIIPATWFYGVLYSGVSMSTALLYLGIVLGMFFFGWVFSREKYTRDKQLATALGVIGLLLVFAPTFGGIGNWLGLAASFVAGVGTSLNLSASKKMPYNPFQTAAIVWTLGVFANLPFIFIFNESLNVFHADIAWMWLAAFALTSVLASGLVIWGLKLVEAGLAGILGLLEIVFGVLFGIIVFHETPGTLAILGTVVIALAALVPYLKYFTWQKRSR